MENKYKNFIIFWASQAVSLLEILLGGFLADNVFEPYMQSENEIAVLLQKIVGTGAGSGMAVMFLCTGILGFITSILWCKNGELRKLNSLYM